MSANAACDLGVRWCGLEAGAFALSWRKARQAQQLCLDTIIDRERTEFIDALRQRTNVANQIFYQCLGYVRFIEKQLSERSAGHRGDDTSRTCFHAGTTGLAIDGCILTEEVAWTKITEADDLTRKRINRDANLAGSNEKHVIASIQIGDNRLSRFAAAPRTMSMHPRQDLFWEISEDTDLR
jgi:hypothetical protein